MFVAVIVNNLDNVGEAPLLEAETDTALEIGVVDDIIVYMDLVKKIGKANSII